jgi:hypothetical protein
MKTALRFLSFFILLTTSVKVNGQINFRSKSEAFTQGASSLTLAKPSNLAIGDLMILAISSGDNNAISAAALPSGWIQIFRGNFGGGNKRASMLAYKIATATEVNSANFVFTVPGANGNAGSRSVGALLTFSGTDRTSPVELIGSIGEATTTTNSVTVPSITTLSNNAAVLMLGCTSGDDNPTWSNWQTASSGTLTEILDLPGTVAGQGVSVAAAWTTKAVPGATGIGTATLDQSERYISLLLSLKSGIENLPVNFTSFTAKPTTDNKVALAWGTSTEQVNKGFRIERQAGNENGKFEQIGFVGSNAKDGNSQNTLTYNFIDAAPKVGAASFYRLVQEDLDGKLTYTEVRLVKLNGQSVSMVFPNPSNGAVNISRTADGKKMNIQVIDQSGKIISQVNNIADANYKLNIQKSGVYTIKMTYPETGEQSIQRIVVQK